MTAENCLCFLHLNQGEVGQSDYFEAETLEPGGHLEDVLLCSLEPCDAAAVHIILVRNQEGNFASHCEEVGRGQYTGGWNIRSLYEYEDDGRFNGARFSYVYQFTSYSLYCT